MLLIGRKKLSKIDICIVSFDKKVKPIKKVKKRHLNNHIKGICLATGCTNGLILFIIIKDSFIYDMSVEYTEKQIEGLRKIQRLWRRYIVYKEFLN